MQPMFKDFLQVKQDLETYYKGIYDEYSLEERDYIISLYDINIQFLLNQMSSYVFEVEFALGHRFSVSTISRLTHNLIIVMAHVYAYMKPYQKVIHDFLMDECFDKNYDNWVQYSKASESIRTSIRKMQLNNIFEIDNINSDDFLDNINIKTGFGGDIPPFVSFEKRLAYLNGSDLLTCLDYMISILNNELTSLKNIGIRDDDSIFGKLFDLNCQLYAKVYWPDKKKNFRLHINKILRNNIEIDELKRERRQIITDFESNPTGKIWKVYSEDKVKMALEMKRQGLNSEQWLYFFENYFEIEDLDSWIEELRNPPESEEDKQKRERLLKSNKVFTLKPAKSKYDVDILLLYFFIRDRFIAEKMFVYEWYALYYILRRVGVITTCTVEDFERQMNGEEWFGHVKKKCSANEINSYHYLDKIGPDVWHKKEIPGGSNSTPKAVDNLFTKYSNLEDTIDEIYVKE